MLSSREKKLFYKQGYHLASTYLIQNDWNDLRTKLVSKQKKLKLWLNK